MNVFQFGDAKLSLGDIDPLYIALWNAKLSLSQRQRYTLAEVTFDHAGIAARITEAKAFWTAMETAARATLRGAPRRYYRGKLALQSLETLEGLYGTPEAAVAALQGSYAHVKELICRHWPGFGPCAAFKLADMAERVCCNKIDYSATGEEEICNSEQVRKGFEKAAQDTGLSGAALVKKLLTYKWATLAGPRYERPVNAQELETILCYYSHDPAHSKHLPGMDAIGIRTELQGYGTLAERLIKKLPRAEVVEQALRMLKRAGLPERDVPRREVELAAAEGLTAEEILTQFQEAVEA